MAMFTPELREQAEEIIARYPQGRERSAVMPLLYLAQSVEGRVTREGLREVAGLLDLKTAEVEAVASFYTMLHLRETGTHVISICTNLSCALRGAKAVYEAARRAAGIPRDGERSEDGMFTVHEEECLGVCEFAPAVQVDFASHDRVGTGQMAEMIAELRAGRVPEPSRGPAMRDLKHASRVLAGVERVEQPG